MAYPAMEADMARITLCCPFSLVIDSHPPVNQRRTRSNLLSKFQKPDSEEKFLRTSGLMGPVRLQFSKEGML